MENSLSNVATKWLTLLGYNVSPEFIDLQISSHPYYPSLASFTDTLADIGVATQVCEVKGSDLALIPMPFLAHINSRADKVSKLMVIKNQRQMTSQSFQQGWDGIVVIHEPEESNRELTRFYEKKPTPIAKTASYVAVAVLLIIFISAIALRPLPDPGTWLISVVNLLGLGLSIATFSHHFGGSLPGMQSLCNVGKSFNCDAVINHPAIPSSIFKHINECLVIYFGSVCLAGILSGGASPRSLLFLLDQTLTFLMAIGVALSIYIQAAIIKKWCLLCLAIGAVITIKMMLFGSALNPLSFPISAVNVSEINALMASLLITTTLCILTKKYLQLKARYKQEALKTLVFKRDKETFFSLMNQQPRANSADFELDIDIRPAAPTTEIIFVFSPACLTCAQTFQEIMKLRLRYREQIAIKFRLLTGPHDSGSLKQSVGIKLLRDIWSLRSDEEKLKEFHRWFKNVLHGRPGKLELIDATQAEINYLMDTYHWSINSGITGTPYVFANHRVLPRGYVIEDLIYYLEEAPGKDPDVAEARQMAAVI